MKKLIYAALAASLFATAAQAHPVVKSAEPAINGTAQASPKQVRIGFSEELVPAFSGLTLLDHKGHVIAKGKGKENVSGKDLVLPVAKPLAPGKYVVKWYAVAKDTHRVKGQYDFTVER